MTSGMAERPPNIRNGTYIGIGGCYFRWGAGLPGLSMRFLFNKGGSRFNGFYLPIARKRFLKELVQNTLSMDSERFVNFPVSADIAIPVHRGYKFFDFHHMTVTRWVASSTDNELFSRELRNVSLASKSGFAPTMIASDLDAGWYVETLIGGTSPHKWDHDSALSYRDGRLQEIQRMIETVNGLEESRETGLQPYVSKLNADIRRLIEVKRAAGMNVTPVVEFVDWLIAELSGFENQSVTLSYTHGDFSLVNAIDCDGCMYMVDWDAGDLRSSTHDACNFALTEQYYARAPAGDMTMLRILTADNLVRLSNRTEGENLFNLALGLYYLERIAVLMSRELSPSLNRVVANSLELFRKVGLPSVSGA